MKKPLILGLVAAALAVVGSAPAMAATGTGWLEICKYSGSPAVSGNFTFTVDGSITKTVAANSCTAPFQVASGTASVVETAEPYALTTSIVTTPSDRLVSSKLTTGSSTVTVPSGGISTATTVAYTDVENPGYIEICKQVPTGSGLTGSFQFTITGAMGFSQSVTVPVGYCSNSIEVPAGEVNVVENAQATYVTDITATNEKGNALVSRDLSTATSTIKVVGVAPNDGDISQESIVTYTDSPSVLKICKDAGSPDVTGSYNFTANGTSVAVPVGACEIVPGVYTAGTTVSISEANTPGQYVSGITVAPSDREVSGSVSDGLSDTVTRSVQVLLGSGETVVTYTDSDAEPGTLKACAAGSSGVFTVTGVTGSTTVPAGSCAILGTFPFGSTQQITEVPAAGDAVTAIAIDPSDRLVGTPNLSAGTVSAWVGSGVTEAQYTNGVAPPVTPATTGSTSSPTSSSSPTTTTIAPQLRFARLIKRGGREYVAVKVISRSRQARIRVTLYGRNGRRMSRVTVFVLTGRTAMVKINAHRVVRIRVKLLS